MTDQPTESDPDVAGIGVLVSFGATAVITFIAIVIGYVTDSLPDSTLTELDRACLAKIQTRPWSSDGPLATLLKNSMTTITAFILYKFPTPDQDLDSDERRKRDRARRSKGLERFVLALSDQQLVTGLAVLIAGYTNRCSRSIYHFRIIAALGWFSSTTHLSTLAVLRAYLIDHPRVRDWRVTAMLGVFGLLVVSQTGTFTTQDNSLPVQCLFESFEPDGLDFLQIIQLVLVILFLGVSYVNRTCRLYTSDADWSLQDWIVEVLARPLIKRNDVRNLERIVVTSPTLSKAEKGATYRRLQQRRRWWKFCGDWVKKRSALSRRGAEVTYLSQEMQSSFLSEILTLLFGVSYGISQVIINRSDIPTGGLSSDQNAMSFGQLVPLLLIALPVLAAGEVYNERHDELGNPPSSLPTFVTQLDPATLLLQDDTDDAVRMTLQMMTNSKAGFYSNSAGPSRQATDSQSNVLFPNTGPAIQLSEISSSTSGEGRLNTTMVTADGQEEESTTPAAAAAAVAAGNDIRRTDDESGAHQATPPINLIGLRTPLKKTRFLLIIFTFQAIFYVFFAITLAGVGSAFLYGIPAIIPSAIAVITVITNFVCKLRKVGALREVDML